MQKTELLLYRLDEIGKSLAQQPTALALIGLGSVGIERSRLDQFSDLDFFIIVQAGSKKQYLKELHWLTDIAPVAYYFANTKDGYKLLYEDGAFCEFAVFEEAELEQAIFTPGRIIWKAQGVDEAIRLPQKSNDTGQQPVEWLIGEALTNLYIGLQREQRGEKLSAMRFIQGHAVDRILELYERLEPAVSVTRDPFSLERRYELRHPAMTHILPQFLQGYEKNRQSALAALSFLDIHFEINATMRKILLTLTAPPADELV